ncbi:hypothetical protein NB640_12315 [Oxalobacter vibrioformis]|uniref:Uncharacterized protein n=1 Tax=Oxalobacter vibrioformis TaxID=933080 RepID=A0A9E9LYJ8_9BURK|nr:hypothetical protein [Oxalobacter vibrioformis]WAW09985.1 hypothetical protein NB640_12315 [Oxalobacter vibrioformis]
MPSFYKEFLLPVFLFLVAATSIIMGIARLGVGYECGVYKEATGRDTKMCFMSCFIKAEDGKWYTYDEHKLFLAGGNMVITGKENK